MCIAIGQPAGTNTITIESLERGWRTNPDGGGYAFINSDGELIMVHSMDEDDFILQYLDHHAKYGETSPFMLHMRIATHGSVNLVNCHPFTVPMQGDAEMSMMHNGIISDMDPYVKDTDLTDTQGLIDNVITSMQDNWLDNTILVEFVEEFIDWSKLVFLTTSPDLEKELYILNEDMGVWRDEVWYSNYSCFAYKKAAYSNRSDSSIDWSTEGNFGWYRNGQYIEGTKDDFARDLEAKDTNTFEDWIIEADDRRATAKQLATATAEQHVAIFNDSMVLGDACAVCTGIKECICHDICHECYEWYHSCPCYGHFVSLAESFDDTWGDRVIAIVDSELSEEKDTAK